MSCDPTHRRFCFLLFTLFVVLSALPVILVYFSLLTLFAWSPGLIMIALLTLRDYGACCTIILDSISNNSEPQTLNPKLETKPKALNPKP